MVGRLGDPFIRRRPDGARRSAERRSDERREQERPGYEGMGLGLFIAKTLLERSGARVTFANGSEQGGAGRTTSEEAPDLARPSGAIVEVVWPRRAIEPSREMARGPLGENPLF
jgi:two-component system, sensor histidine kinase RegB